MPRIIVEAEGPAREAVFWEHVAPEDFEAEHFRKCLCDRVAWAVSDAVEAERTGTVDVDDPIVIHDERLVTERERVVA